MSLELLQREIEHLRAKHKPQPRKSKATQVEQEAPVVSLFANASSEQDVLLLYIEHILKDVFVFETDIFTYNSEHKLHSATANQSAEVLAKYVQNYEESGIIDWLSEKKLASIIPNLDDSSGDMSNTYFLLVPLFLRDLIVGFAVSRTNISPMELSEQRLKQITEFSYYAALALDNLRSKVEIQNMNAKLLTFNKSVSAPAELDSITEITSSISEEIANSVKIVQANISLIENGVGDYLQRIRIIRQQVELINLLNNKLLGISSNGAEDDEEVFSLSAVLDDILLFSNSQLQRDGIIVRKEIESEAINISGSKSKLEQALLNILLFSRDKLEEGGRIDISLYEARNNKANLIINDNSIGLNQSEEDTIFEPYVVNPDKKMNITGLYLANNIITNYKGKLEVISELGKGITYKITLPLHKALKK